MAKTMPAEPELRLWTYRCTRTAFGRGRRWVANIIYDVERPFRGPFAGNFELLAEPPPKRFRILGIEFGPEEQRQNLETMARTPPIDRARRVLGCRTAGMMPYDLPGSEVKYYPAKPVPRPYDPETSTIEEDLPVW